MNPQGAPLAPAGELPPSRVIAPGPAATVPRPAAPAAGPPGPTRPPPQQQEEVWRGTLLGNLDGQLSSTPSVAYSMRTPDPTTILPVWRSEIRLVPYIIDKKTLSGPAKVAFLVRLESDPPHALAHFRAYLDTNKQAVRHLVSLFQVSRTQKSSLPLGPEGGAPES